MKMEKKKFRIGELADKLEVERFVVRFWEKEFNLEFDRSDGGQRFYTEDNLTTFMRIKELLYNQGFTIQGAKKQLAIDAAAKAKLATIAPTKSSGAQKTDWDPELTQQIGDLKEKLKKLRQLLS